VLRGLAVFVELGEAYQAAKLQAVKQMGNFHIIRIIVQLLANPMHLGLFVKTGLLFELLNGFPCFFVLIQKRGHQGVCWINNHHRLGGVIMKLHFG